MLPGWPESEVTPRHIYSLLLPMKVRKFNRRSWAQGKNYVALSPGALKRRSITLITLSDDRSDRSVLAKLEAELQAALTTRELPNDRSQEQARQNALRLEETANSPTTCLRPTSRLIIHKCCVDLCGSLWILVDLSGSLWIFVDICGYRWG